jgi:F0F1-type ATP synthase epsilon subunit
VNLRLFRLAVWTPEEPLLDAEEVAWVQVHLADGGGIGIYPGHAPLVAETATAPLRYADPAGEHALDLEAGILQVDAEGVMIFTSGTSQPCEGGKPSQGLEEAHFDRLAQALVATMRAQPDGMADLGLEAGEE